MARSLRLSAAHHSEAAALRSCPVMPRRGYGELIHLKAACHLGHPMLPLSSVQQEMFMTDLPAGPRGEPWFKKTRAAALGFGLGATLALSPLVWAQNPPASGEAAPAPPAAGVPPPP